MQNVLKDLPRKTDDYTVRLKGRQHGNNHESLYLEIYDRATKKQNLQFLNLYLTGNSTDTATLLLAKGMLANFKGEVKKKTCRNFTEYVEAQIAEIEKEQSRKNPRSALARLHEYAGTTSITYKRASEDNFLSGFRKWLLNEALSETDGELLNKSTADNYLSIIMRYANRGKEAGLVHIPKKVKAIGKVVKVPVTFSKAEIITLFSTQYPAAPQIRKAFMLQYFSMQRWGDVRDMTWEVLNSSEFLKNVTQEKTGHTVSILFNAEFMEWIREGEEKSGLIFHGIPKDDQTVREHLRDWCVLADITKDEQVGTHIFRRSSATNLYHEKDKQGKQLVDIYLISKMLGHSSIDMTLRYIGVSKEDLMAGFELLYSISGKIKF